MKLKSGSALAWSGRLRDGYPAWKNAKYSTTADIAGLRNEPKGFLGHEDLSKRVPGAAFGANLRR
jgi:hypothetical protein